ncbi:hypothetical protein GCM10011581_26540 [Saccharopolyspora subtropica]|uniref:Transposase n=1 Tax=Saccharopolyspora thermophila TaxID=89367 RepID=A0A917NC78_9PSEU|nr:hypothetical protein GCM10011581_26540 [Saccharopolyspora subtropica]
MTQLLPMVADLPAIAGKHGRPHTRFLELYDDTAYDSNAARKALRDGHHPVPATQGARERLRTQHLPMRREHAIAWLPGFRRLRIRWENLTSRTKHSCSSH